MRTEEIRKWIEEGGELPQELTQEEKEHLEALGWKENRRWNDKGQLWWEENFLHDKTHGKCRMWYYNGQLEHEYSFLHGTLHGKCRGWRSNGQLRWDEEWLYGNKIK